MAKLQSRRIEAKKGTMNRNPNRCQLVQERALIARSPTDRDVKHFLDPMEPGYKLLITPPKSTMRITHTGYIGGVFDSLRILRCYPVHALPLGGGQNYSR